MSQAHAEPESPASGSAHSSQRTQAIREGHWVLFRLPSGDVKNLKLTKNSTISFGKFGTFNSNALIGQPYGLSYDIVDKELTIKPPKRMDELEDTDATNEYINDGNIVQPLTAIEIETLKKSGIHASEIIKQQIEQHANYELKTEYSKEKYKKRKEAKFAKSFTTIEPTVHNMCEYWFQKDRSRIRDMRVDTLGQMMNLAGVRPGGRYMVVDEASGLLVTSVLERVGKGGKVFAICDTESPPAYPILYSMNFDDSFISSTLISLNWATADEEHEPLVASTEPDGGIIRSERQRHRLNKRKKTTEELFDIRNEFFEGEFEGLLVASEYEPISIVERLSRYLTGSASIVIHSPHLQVLCETQSLMRPIAKYLCPSISEGWLRQYQVLPGRTHPTMNTSGSGGYILHSIYVFDDPTAHATPIRNRKKRKVNASEPSGTDDGTSTATSNSSRATPIAVNLGS